MMLWKWLNKPKFDKDKRRPISGRRYPAISGQSVKAHNTHTCPLWAYEKIQSFY